MNPTTNTEAGAVADVAAKLTEAQRRGLTNAIQTFLPWPVIGQSSVRPMAPRARPMIPVTPSSEAS